MHQDHTTQRYHLCRGCGRKDARAESTPQRLCTTSWSEGHHNAETRRRTRSQGAPTPPQRVPTRIRCESIATGEKKPPPPLPRHTSRRRQDRTMVAICRTKEHTSADRAASTNTDGETDVAQHKATMAPHEGSASPPWPPSANHGARQPQRQPAEDAGRAKRRRPSQPPRGAHPRPTHCDDTQLKRDKEPRQRFQRRERHPKASPPSELTKVRAEFSLVPGLPQQPTASKRGVLPRRLQGGLRRPQAPPSSGFHLEHHLHLESPETLDTPTARTQEDHEDVGPNGSGGPESVQGQIRAAAGPTRPSREARDRRRPCSRSGGGTQMRRLAEGGGLAKRGRSKSRA
jgi:hypothetical protein